MAKIAIVCDTYKLKKYETTLKKEGFFDYEVSDFKMGMGLIKLIKIKTDLSNRVEIGRICTKLESYFLSKRN